LSARPLRGQNRLFIILFFLLDFNLFVIILLKVKLKFINATITYYQIIENMARENNIGENQCCPKKYSEQTASILV
jgi:hypothetical protein